MKGGFHEEVINISNTQVQALYRRAHRYKPTSLKLISTLGLESRILDAGGGERSLKLPGYVNADLFRLPGFVQVVCDAHRLPFRDSVFDIVLLEAVLEHFQKPWVAVSEFHRVLKPGGYIYADVAFMVPVHGYPHHYFNMTRDGVRVLFEGFEEIASGVQDYQMPSYALAYLLSRYISCLVPGIYEAAKGIEVYDTGTWIHNRQRFTVASLLGYGFNLLNRILRGFDRVMSPERAMEIAAGVYFLGKKSR